MRIDSQSNGQEKAYRLKANSRGRMVRSALYQVKVYQSSGGNAQVGLDTLHGPDGEIYVTLKQDTVPYTGVGTTPTLLSGAVGAADSNAEVIGEWLLASLKIKDSAAAQPQWAIVEVFETWKPF